MAHRSFLTSLSRYHCLSRVVTLPALSSLTDGYNDYFAVPLGGERGSDQRMTPRQGLRVMKES